MPTKNKLEVELTSPQVYRNLKEGKLVELFKDIGQIKGCLRFDMSTAQWYYREEAAGDSREHSIPRDKAVAFIEKYLNEHNAGVRARNAERLHCASHCSPIKTKTMKLTKKTIKK